MSHRAIVNVASDSWVKGQERLTAKLAEFGEDYVIWRDALPEGCPPHRTRGKLGAPTGCVPYAFKPYALNWASLQGYTSLLWCDASIVPIRPASCTVAVPMVPVVSRGEIPSMIKISNKKFVIINPSGTLWGTLGIITKTLRKQLRKRSRT